MRISPVSTAGFMRACSANTILSWVRSASTADCMSGYCSLAASARPSWPNARCTWPSDAEAAGCGSKLLKRCAQSGPSSAIMRRRTNAGPIGGACDCSCDSSCGVLGRQRLGDGGQQLRHLHDRPLEAAERRGQRRGVLAVVGVRPKCAGPQPGPPPRRRWCRPARSAPRAPRAGSVLRPCRRSRVRLLASGISGGRQPASRGQMRCGRCALRLCDGKRREGSARFVMPDRPLEVAPSAGRILSPSGHASPSWRWASRRSSPGAPRFMRWACSASRSPPIPAGARASCSAG